MKKLHPADMFLLMIALVIGSIVVTAIVGDEWPARAMFLTGLYLFFRVIYVDSIASEERKKSLKYRWKKRALSFCLTCASVAICVWSCQAYATYPTGQIAGLNVIRGSNAAAFNIIGLVTLLTSVALLADFVPGFIILLYDTNVGYKPKGAPANNKT